MDVTYYKLLDFEHYGQVVKAVGRKNYEYDENTNEWVRSGIMSDYFFYFYDESPRSYGDYEEISEEKAMKLIEKYHKTA